VVRLIANDQVVLLLDLFKSYFSIYQYFLKIVLTGEGWRVCPSQEPAAISSEPFKIGFSPT
jgi:hypothetical protein